MKIYGRTTGCPACTATKKFLDMQNKEYTFIDIDSDEKALEYLQDLGLTSLPVIDVDGEIWSGFDPAKLSQYV